MLIHPQIDPVALQIGPLAIHWYGLTYLAAFGLFLWLGLRRLHHEPFASSTGPGAWAIACFTSPAITPPIRWKSSLSGKAG